MMCVLALILGAIAADAYPVSYENCGVSNTVQKSPERVITMNQGATEMMLALGLADKMVGTAYLDDAIWPYYAADYNKIETLSGGYPPEDKIMSVNPDFIVGSYNSAFREAYNNSRGKKSGIFEAVGPCVGEGSEWEGARATCRPQLNAAGISTYLMQDACEDRTLRPAETSEETVYSEMRQLGSVFKVDVEPMIQEMKDDFDGAAALVQSGMHGDKLRVVWVDCVGRCCGDDTGEKVFVGGATGVPNMLMKEAGLENVFADPVLYDGGWTCVNATDIAAANPDVLVIAHAAWDTAEDKLKHIYSNPAFCNMDAVKGAAFIQIPFSATTLSPRNGPAAYDLAVSAIHVRTGALTQARESGVSSFGPQYLKSLMTENSVCQMNAISYTMAPTSPTSSPTSPTKSPTSPSPTKSPPTKSPTAPPTLKLTSSDETTVSGCFKGARWPWAFAWVLAWQFWM
jgi:iron complex transport system substrate-binding protein